MIIKSLRLKNYRKFKDAIIEFPDGVTGVIGLNGVGKSSIFEAIAWVLFGPVAARTSADQIKREGTESNETCRVELEFVIDNDNYRIVREMAGKNLSTSASVLVNCKIAASGTETVNKYTKKKLGMDFKSFYTSIFAKQKELNALSSMIASERRPFILRMLGIDSLDNIIKEIKSDRRHKDLFIEKLSNDLIDEKGENRIEKFKEEIEKLEKEKEKVNSILKKYQEKIKFSEKESKRLDKEYLNKKNEYEKVNIRKEKLDDEKILFDSKEKYYEEIKYLQNKIMKREKIIEKQKRILSEFKNLNQDIKNVENRLNKADKLTYEIVKKIEQKKTFIENIKRNTIEIEHKGKIIKKMGPEANCPTCNRVLGNQYDKLIIKFNEDKSKMEKEIESKLKDIKIDQEYYETTIREKQALEKKRKYLQSRMSEKEKTDITIRNILEEIKRERSEIEEKEKKLMKIRIVKFNLKEYNDVKKQVKEFYSKYQSSLDLLNRMKEKLGDEKLEFEKIESQKKLIVQEIKNSNEKTDRLIEFKNRIKEEKIYVQNLKMLDEIMVSFRLHLISRIRPALSSYASDYFGRLTDGKYQEIELNENYDIMVYDQGNLYGIERFSGGEEDLANLCLRLAISEIITEQAGGLFNFIILDEIFGSQDIIRRQNIMKALRNLSSKFRQIFLITHIDDIKNYMENVISIRENEDNISVVKIE